MAAVSTSFYYGQIKIAWLGSLVILTVPVGRCWTVKKQVLEGIKYKLTIFIIGLITQTYNNCIQEN